MLNIVKSFLTQKNPRFRGLVGILRVGDKTPDAPAVLVGLVARRVRIYVSGGKDFFSRNHGHAVNGRFRVQIFKLVWCRRVHVLHLRKVYHAPEKDARDFLR